jgi:hypothetical protein
LVQGSGGGRALPQWSERTVLFRFGRRSCLGSERRNDHIEQAGENGEAWEDRELTLKTMLRSERKDEVGCNGIMRRRPQPELRKTNTMEAIVGAPGQSLALEVSCR